MFILSFFLNRVIKLIVKLWIMKIMYENCGVKKTITVMDATFVAYITGQVSQVRWTRHFLLSVNPCGCRWVEEAEQETHNAWFNFTWNHAPSLPPQAHPLGFAIFFFCWRSIPYHWAHRKRQFPTPELLIDNHIYVFCYIFLIRTKAKWHVFTTFMNVFLSLSKEG